MAKMSIIQILSQSDGSVKFEASDDATVNQLRRAFTANGHGLADRHLVRARELAHILRAAGEGQWANILDQAEEAHMVTVVFTPTR